MALPFPIAPSQTDSKSPVDDILMDSIREDLGYVEGLFSFQKTFDYEFKINGPLVNYPVGQRNRLDGALVAAAQTFTRARLYLENPGTSGDLEIDVRKYKRPNTPIDAISRQYTAALSGISQIAPATATQSVSIATPQIATQSITRWQPTIAVLSIILLGNNLVRYNLAATPPNTDWLVGDSVGFSGCTSAANNIIADIVRVNDDGVPCLIVTNASGVAQTSPAGTSAHNAWSYNYINPVSSQFAAGENVVFASHTTGANNGTFPIFAVNLAGNNIIIKNANGGLQGGVAGNANVQRWTYTFSAAAPVDFVFGEKARFAGHQQVQNDGDFLIVGTNVGGNNLIVINPNGQTQNPNQGTVNTLRWIYALPTDPTSSFIIGNTAVITGATSGVNNGVFSVVQINRLATNNLVFYNALGVAQGGAAGTLAHTRMLLKFTSDQSAVYSTASVVETFGTVSALDVGTYPVLEVNRGGGANYNVVVDNPTGIEQASSAGRIILESRSIFTTKPKLTMPTEISNSTNRHMQYMTSTAFNAEAVVTLGTVIAVDLTQVPNGAPSDVVVQLV